MKVKELIRELQACNPEADVELDTNDEYEPNAFVEGIESSHPNVVTILIK